MSEKEALKPCPFCGKDPLPFRCGGWLEGYFCMCYRRPDKPPFFPRSVEEWQNAYCWKEIDTLRAELENQCIMHSETIENLESALKVAKEALEGIRSVTPQKGAVHKWARSALSEISRLEQGEKTGGEK